MALTPAVLEIGDFHVQGGLPAMAVRFSLSATDPRAIRLATFNDPKLMQFLPADAAGAEPASPTYHPWYDGSSSATEYAVVSTGASTVTVTGTPWTTNQHAGRKITIIGRFIEEGFENRVYTIASNTNNTITITTSWGAFTPAVGQLFRIGTGQFQVYNAVPGSLGITTAGKGLNGGSSWQTDGSGVGSDAVYLREFAERVWPSSPYFHAVKFAGIGALGASWGVGQVNRVAFANELPLIAAAAAARGNTLDWKLIVIDVSAGDIADPLTHAASFRTNLSALVTWLKSPGVLNAPNAYVQIVMHHPRLYNVSAPGSAFFIRSEILAYMRSPEASGRVSVVDMADARFASPTLAAGSPSEVGDPQYYIWQDYARRGTKIVDTYIAQSTATTSVATNGKAVYLLIGDSIAVGEMTPQWITELKAASLIGTTPGSTVRPARQQVYNREANQLQTFDPTTNPNRSGTVTANCGPIISITAELDKIHGANGFVIVPRGSSGSALVSPTVPYNPASGGNGRWAKSANEHFTEMTADVKAAFALVFAAGFVPDLRGIFVMLGDNDSTTPGAGSAFSLALRTFIEDLSDFTTRTSGKPPAVILRRPQPATSLGLETERQIIRQAIQSAATTYPHVAWYDVDDLERNRLDNIHETPESGLENGRRAVEALKRVMN
jgi:hypothetical protein